MNLNVLFLLGGRSGEYAVISGLILHIGMPLLTCLLIDDICNTTKQKRHVFTHNAHAYAKSTHILNIALLALGEKIIFPKISKCL